MLPTTICLVVIVGGFLLFTLLKKPGRNAWFDYLDRQAEKTIIPPPRYNGRLKLFQIAIVLSFIASDIQWHWVDSGLASGVMGGMVAWYLTGLIVYLMSRSSLRRGRRDIEPL